MYLFHAFHSLPGYNGIPPACTPKCFKDHDCPSNMACIHGKYNEQFLKIK